MEYNNSFGFSKNIALDAILYVLEEQEGSCKIEDLMNTLYLFERDNMVKYAMLRFNDEIVSTMKGFSFTTINKMIQESNDLSSDWHGYIKYDRITGIIEQTQLTQYGELSEADRDSLSACAQEVISINRANDTKYFISLPEHVKVWGFDNIPISLKQIYETYTDLPPEYIQEALDEIDYCRLWDDFANRMRDE